MAAPAASIVEDITTRFVLTAPQEQLCSFEGLMFLVEQAHWFYEDHVREQDPALRSYNLAGFTKLVFDNCPELKHYVGDVAVILEAFNSFKRAVPVMGGILLDGGLDKVLLVKGWKNSASWGFPRGKINTGESDMDCAVREVLEETGYDVEGQLAEEDSISINMGGKRNKLYIVAGLDPGSAQFAPKNKGEIGGYAWHRVADLPDTKEAADLPYQAADGSRHKFYMVWPYIRPLKRWINKRRRDAPQWDCPLQTAPAAATLAALSLPTPSRTAAAHSSSSNHYHQADALHHAAAGGTQQGVDRTAGFFDQQYSGGAPLSSMGSGSSSQAGGGAADGAGAAAGSSQQQQGRGLFKFDQAAVMRALLSGAAVIR